MKKLIAALVAGMFAAATLTAIAADPVKSGGSTDKPGRAADEGSAVKSGGSTDKPGRTAIFEVMINTPSVAALIRDNKTFRINSDIQTGAKHGMVTLDSFLMDKYVAGMISREEVITKSYDPTTVQAKLQEYEMAQAIAAATGKPQ